MRTLIASSATVALILAAAVPSAFAQARQAEAPQGRFCLQFGTEGQARCGYRTLAQCEHARRSSAGRCFDRTYMIAATPPPDPAAEPRRVTRHAKPSW
jgi:hypothetical protein